MEEALINALKPLASRPALTWLLLPCGRAVPLTLLGNISRQVQFPLQALVTRQIKVQGSCAICGEYPAVLELMEQGKINTESMLSAEVPLSEGADWFRRLYQKEKGLYKVILKPGQET